jgi:hypothetical protein
VNLEPATDATIYEELFLNANGSGQYLHSGTTGLDDQRRALVGFDVAESIPAGSTITDAALTLFVSRAPKNGVESSIFLHRLEVDWGEGPSVPGGVEGKGIPAEEGDSTWTLRLFSLAGSVFWTAAGGDGDYNPAASATTTVPDTEVKEEDEGFPGFSVMWSSSMMADDVQRWLDDPSSDFGWIVIGSTTARSVKRFNTRENIIEESRPRLSVTYVPEPEAGWSGLAAFTTLVALRAGRRSTGVFRRPTRAS